MVNGRGDWIHFAHPALNFAARSYFVVEKYLPNILSNQLKVVQMRREAWRKLYRLFYEERYSELEIELERLKNSKDRLERAMRYDFLDIMTKNPPAKLRKVNLKSELKAGRRKGGGRCSVYAS